MNEVNKKHHFNVMDFIIIIALCIAIAFIVFCVLGNDPAELTAPKCQVSYILAIDTPYSVYTSVDDEVFTKNGKSAGKIISISRGAETTYITVISTAYLVDDCLFIKGQKIAQDESFDVVFANDKAFSLKCTRTIIYS